MLTDADIRMFIFGLVCFIGGGFLTLVAIGIYHLIVRDKDRIFWSAVLKDRKNRQELEIIEKEIAAYTSQPGTRMPASSDDRHG